ncbi:unnamed protein product [Porites evermanni]|uniref:Glutamate--cysteine ligase n=1 Tax=Porites evermanni TaxID=104178 RepID=A0ABN8T102_9CNID|nr:unnamed protein product [Porites evermanni]
MGLLSLGSPLSWSETKQYADHVRKHGILQFLHIYNKLKDRENDCLKWGDEVEYTLLKFDHENRKVFNNLRAKEVLDVLQLDEIKNPSTNKTAWRPEYAGYMVEGNFPGTSKIQACYPLKENRFVIPKSRYDSISTYLSPEGNKYSDIDLVHDKGIYQQLVDAGIDEQLARHYAHLFIRDPLTLFHEHIYEDDEQHTDHFEVHLSIHCFLTLFNQNSINSFLCFLYIADLVRKKQRNCCFFSILLSLGPTVVNGDAANEDEACKDEFELMSIDKIINGKDGEFPGLIPLIESYLGNVDVDIDTRCTISQYLKFIQRKASGELLTTAQWIRKFVEVHPEYKQDSVVSESICYDLMNTFDRISRGELGAPQLFGKPTSKTSDVLLKKCLEIKEEMKKIEAEK